MIRKIIWLDEETTGLIPGFHDPIQIAGMIEIDGKIEEEFDIKSQPIDGKNVDPDAMKIHGITPKELWDYPLPYESKIKLNSIMEKYVNKYDSHDKFYPAGYNVKFDMDMLAGWYKKLKDNYLGSFLNWRFIDPMPLLIYAQYRDRINLPDFKLETACKHFNIPIKAHDAMSDIRATRALFLEAEKELFK